MNLVFISLLLFLPAVAAQDVCRSCIDQLFLNFTANVDDSTNSTLSMLAKLRMESEALLFKDCIAPEKELLNVEADIECFHLVVTDGVIPLGKKIQMFGPVTFLENTTLLDSLDLLDRNSSDFFNITTADGFTIMLRITDNLLMDSKVKPQSHLWMALLTLGVVLAAFCSFAAYISSPYYKPYGGVPPYVRYQERIRVGMEPLPTIHEEPAPQMNLAEVTPSDNVFLVSYSHTNEEVTIRDGEGAPLGESPATGPVPEIEVTAPEN